MKESTHRGEQDGHSPEPWSEVNYTDLDALKECNAPFGLLAGDGKALFMTMADGNPLLLDDDSARIVACVNACAGVPTEALERWGSWMSKYTEICPDCRGSRGNVTTVGLQIDGKMEKYTQLHTLCNNCKGIGRVEKEATDGR